jgi:hypothetical protein
MKIYYKVWVDCILRLKSIESNKDNWKSKSMILMSIVMAFNLILIMIILQRNVFGYFYEIKLNVLSGFQNYTLTILILYLLPSVLIDYLLIIRGNRYLKLIEKYPYRDGKLVLIYILISIFLPIILLLGGIVLTKLSII